VHTIKVKKSPQNQSQLDVVLSHGNLSGLWDAFSIFKCILLDLGKGKSL
jgi:hypothetical protein